jgi:hypothetical protein
MIPFLDRLEKAKRILIAGCGGGFDLFAGIPVAEYLTRIIRRMQADVA